MAKRICSIVGCTAPSKTRGLCNRHYLRWWKYGDTEVVKNDVSLTVIERFVTKVGVDRATGCWIWLGPLTDSGYARFSIGYRTVQAHRWSYEHFVGPADGLEVDHVWERGCRHRHCVNPDHLEAVPGAENNRRSRSPSALNARKTHCMHGHEFTPENTLITPAGGRRCRACNRERSLRYYNAARGR